MHIIKVEPIINVDTNTIQAFLKHSLLLKLIWKNKTPWQGVHITKVPLYIHCSTVYTHYCTLYIKTQNIIRTYITHAHTHTLALWSPSGHSKRGATKRGRRLSIGETRHFPAVYTHTHAVSNNHDLTTTNYVKMFQVATANTAMSPLQYKHHLGIELS